MADRQTTIPVEGETRLGSDRDGQQGIVFVATNAGADKPSILALDAVGAAGARTTYYLWVDRTGDLRISATVPTDEDANGTIVGTQS